MRIDGSWRLCDDGIIRPIIRGEIRTKDGSWVQISFLADSGADRTVLSPDILGAVDLPALPASEQLQGFGGKAATVEVESAIQLRDASERPVTFAGRIAAVTDPAILDMSLLGRDITNQFALIIDRPQDVVCLLGQRHRYQIQEG